MSNVLEKIKNYENTIKERQAQAQTIKESRIRLESKLEQLNKNKQEFIDKLTAMGIDHEKLGTYINERTTTLDEIMNKLNDVMPDENGVAKKYNISMDLNKAEEVKVVTADINIPSDVDLKVSAQPMPTMPPASDFDLESLLLNNEVNTPDAPTDDMPF